MTKAILKGDGGYGASVVDLGQAIAQATLVAYEEGLGTCLNACGDVSKALGLPESCKVVLLQTLGYAAENRNAGGQRPRAPFGELFFRNTVDNPMSLSPEIEAELKEAKLICDPAPLPGRKEEIQELAKKFNLPTGE